MSQTLAEQRDTLVKAAKDIVNGAVTEKRDLTDEENTLLETKTGEIAGLDKQIKGKSLVDSVLALGTAERDPDQPKAAKSLGEHFALTVGPKLKENSGQRSSLSTPEFVLRKANTDTQDKPTLDSPSTINLSDVDTTIVPEYRRRPVVADLLGSGSISGSAITYFIEGLREGDFAGVAEGAAKPQIHYVDPTPVTDTLKKIAAWWKTTDEMNEDLAFLVSEINRRAVYDLAMFEEDAILNGGGGNSLTGILARSIGSETAVDEDDEADALFRAMTKVMIDSGLDADGLVIHPMDYQNLRLKRDANEQYFGGGFFSGAYGVGAGVTFQPPVWGLRTIVTPSIAQGTALVGAFQQGATLYRKGGVRVESTNSHDDDFTNNLRTTRVEERVALAVRRPKAFVEVTLVADES